MDHCNLLMLIKYVTDTHVAVGCSLQHTTNSPPVGVLQLTTILASGCFQFPFLLQLQSDWTAIKVQTKLPIFEKTHLCGPHERRRVNRFKLRRDVEPLTVVAIVTADSSRSIHVTSPSSSSRRLVVALPSENVLCDLVLFSGNKRKH